MDYWTLRSHAQSLNYAQDTWYARTARAKQEEEEDTRIIVPK